MHQKAIGVFDSREGHQLADRLSKQFGCSGLLQAEQCLLKLKRLVIFVCRTASLTGIDQKLCLTPGLFDGHVFSHLTLLNDQTSCQHQADDE